MKTEKIKDNPTRIEELEWLLKCAKHYEAGGKITTLIHQGSYDKSESDFKFNKEAKHYEIVLEPEYRPYKTVEEVPVGKVIIAKDYKTAIISAYKNANNYLRVQTSGPGYAPDELLEKFTFENGSACGVEVEG